MLGLVENILYALHLLDLGPYGLHQGMQRHDAQPAGGVLDLGTGRGGSYLRGHIVLGSSDGPPGLLHEDTVNGMAFFYSVSQHPLAVDYSNSRLRKREQRVGHVDERGQCTLVFCTQAEEPADQLGELREHRLVGVLVRDGLEDVLKLSVRQTIGDHLIHVERSVPNHTLDVF